MTECNVKQAVIYQIRVVTSLVGMPRVPLLRDKCFAEVGGHDSIGKARAVSQNHYKKVQISICICILGIFMADC